jgi:hypothetical protein
MRSLLALSPIRSREERNRDAQYHEARKRHLEDEGVPEFTSLYVGLRHGYHKYRARYLRTQNSKYRRLAEAFHALAEEMTMLRFDGDADSENEEKLETQEELKHEEECGCPLQPSPKCTWVDSVLVVIKPEDEN